MMLWLTLAFLAGVVFALVLISVWAMNAGKHIVAGYERHLDRE